MRKMVVMMVSVLWLLAAPMVSANESVIIEIEIGESIDEIAADHNIAVLEPLPLLQLYRVEAADFSADPRILTTYDDSYLDARPSYVVATGDILGALPVVGSITAVLEQPSAELIRIAQAHTISRGAGIKVAVLDTGVEIDHPLIATNIITGYNFVDGDNSADDEATFADTDGDFMLDEAAGHGTHVAGIIATVAPDAEILPVRIFDSNGRGTNFALAQGIMYAVEQGAHVINLSGNSADNVPYVQAAIDYAAAQGVVVIASAGLNTIGYPAAHQNAISVASVNANDWRTILAYFIDGEATVYAPGEWVLSSYFGGRYARWTGHSMATPFVAGTAALMRSEGCAADCVRDNLLSYARPINNGTVGRRVDVYDALGAASGQQDVALTTLTQQVGLDTPYNNVRKVVLKLDNQAHSLTLDEVTVRYWYTNESESAETFVCDWAAIGCENVSGTFGVVDGEQYVEVSFADEVVFGSADSGEIHIRTYHNDWSNYDETNDWSYNPTHGLTAWERVTVYHAGELVAGVEPFGVPTAVAHLNGTAATTTVTAPFLLLIVMTLSLVLCGGRAARRASTSRRHPL